MNINSYTESGVVAISPQNVDNDYILWHQGPQRGKHDTGQDA
jgi:hypothetical protein